MSKVYIGIDNGVTGTIGVVGDDIQPQIFHTPVKKEQDFTKAKNLVSRLDYEGFMAIFNQFNKNDIHVVCERPMINPTRWKASMSAIRCWEAQLIILEVLGVPHQFIASKEWQRELLLASGCFHNLRTSSMVTLTDCLSQSMHDVKTCKIC